MKKKFTFEVLSGEENQRLDQFLKGHLGGQGVSRNQIQKWIRREAVLLNGKRSLPSHSTKIGETVTLQIPREESQVLPEKIPLEILHEDRHLLVVNKPAGMLSHPTGSEPRGSLANALAHHLRNENKKWAKGFGPDFDRRPGIVHRLDRETSGVLVVAKTVRVLEHLSRQFRERGIEKVYRTLVVGRIEPKQGEIEGPIGKAVGSGKMTVTASGRASRTDFKVLKLFPAHTYLEVYPKTGRTHQIRVHLAKIGTPVLGDKRYGKREEGLRQMLHAYRLIFTHPATKKKVTFTAPLPQDFLLALKRLDSEKD